MGIGEEYLDENVCLHEDVSVSDIICHCGSIEVRVVCDNCGKGQTQHYDIQLLIDDLEIGWNE
tara:strand:- start:486 stop:674 length:189 start_codon:yes stop_codon:yes gene_type:complete